MMKRKWWILGGAALAVAVSLCFFGVRVRIAPRLILSKAMQSAIEQLDKRFEKSPAHLLRAAVDARGLQKAKLKLETEEKYLGAVIYDMTLNTQLSPNRIMAEGSVVTGGSVLDLSLFVDENFAAVSSNELLDGKFYGITYDTFSQDIRKWQLLAALIGDDVIDGWENAVSALREKMSAELSLPEVKPEEVRKVLFAALALKPGFSRQEISLPDGIHNAYGVTFRASGAEIASAAENYRAELSPALLALIDGMEQDPESEVSAEFLLHKGKLVQIKAKVQNAEQTVEILLHLGEIPAEQPLAVEVKNLAGEDLNRYSLQIMTESDGESYQEKLCWVHTDNGYKNSLILDYQWDLSNGDMILEIHRDGMTTQQRLNLTGEEESLTIRSQNIRPLLNLLLEQERATPAICSLTIEKGRDVAAPEYKNLDLWSIEDLFTLLGRFGGFLGLNLP